MTVGDVTHRPKEWSLSGANQNWAVPTANDDPRGLAIINDQVFVVGDASGALFGYGVMDGGVDIFVKAGPRNNS